MIDLVKGSPKWTLDAVTVTDRRFNKKKTWKRLTETSFNQSYETWSKTDVLKIIYFAKELTGQQKYCFQHMFFI